MEAVIAGAIAAVVGLISGQAVSIRLSNTKGTDPKYTMSTLMPKKMIPGRSEDELFTA